MSLISEIKTNAKRETTVELSLIVRYRRDEIKSKNEFHLFVRNKTREARIQFFDLSIVSRLKV